MVTKRIKPMMIDGKRTYQIGIPIHWGYRGIAEDGATPDNPAASGMPRTAHTPTNMLSPTVFDPNAYTPEYKAFLVKIEKA
jgi:formate dehydrogenase major subunit